MTEDQKSNEAQKSSEVEAVDVERYRNLLGRDLTEDEVSFLEEIQAARDEETSWIPTSLSPPVSGNVWRASRGGPIMDLDALAPGDRLELRDGSVVRVVQHTPDGEHLPIVYEVSRSRVFSAGEQTLGVPPRGRPTRTLRAFSSPRMTPPIRRKATRDRKRGGLRTGTTGASTQGVG